MATAFKVVRPDANTPSVNGQTFGIAVVLNPSNAYDTSESSFCAIDLGNDGGGDESSTIHARVTYDWSPESQYAVKQLTIKYNLDLNDHASTPNGNHYCRISYSYPGSGGFITFDELLNDNGDQTINTVTKSIFIPVHDVGPMQVFVDSQSSFSPVILTVLTRIEIFDIRVEYVAGGALAGYQSV